MLITKNVTVKWNPANIKYYTELGYEYTGIGQEFTVKVEHLSKGSHTKIEIQCDYCGVIVVKKWKKHLLTIENEVTHKDACNKCIQYKTKESMLEIYGVTTLLNTDKSREKASQTISAKYGVDNVFKLPEIREKAMLTCIEKYGEDYYKMQKRKSEETMLKKYNKKSLPASGKDHYRWEGGITPFDKQERHSLKYDNWRNSVFERDNYVCQCCGKRGNELQAHHLNAWKEYDGLRFNVDNGVTLCVECHKEFHNLYSRLGDNTREQFEKFIANIEKM